jgi:hypothetical protein
MAEDRKLSEFVLELSELGRRYGFGLAGDIEVYELEREDCLFNYVEDTNGFLRFGDANADPRTWTGRNAEGGVDADASSHVREKNARVA